MNQDQAPDTAPTAPAPGAAPGAVLVLNANDSLDGDDEDDELKPLR